MWKSFTNIDTKSAMTGRCLGMYLYSDGQIVWQNGYMPRKKKTDEQPNENKPVSRAVPVGESRKAGRRVRRGPTRNCCP